VACRETACSVSLKMGRVRGASRRLFDHLIGAQDDRLRNGEIKGFGHFSNSTTLRSISKGACAALGALL
jgi:hypothetical protein